MKASCPLADDFDRRSLRERCVAYLRTQIVSGALKPGEHIKEMALAETLGISRGTIREALRTIENEGLVENDGRGHISVRSLSPKQISDVFEVRTALEILAASKLAQRADRQQLADKLEQSLQPLKRSDLEFGDRIEIDLSFHALLCKLTDNNTLVAAWSQLIGPIRVMIIAAGAARAADRMRYDEHVPITHAIRSGDTDRVRETVMDHMSDFASRYVGDVSDADESSASAYPS